MRILFYTVTLGLIAGLSHADDYVFYSRDGDWMNIENWKNETTNQKGWINSNNLSFPGENDTVRFKMSDSKGILNTDAGTINVLEIGANGSTLILNAGAKLIVAKGQNKIGCKAPGNLTVNGGYIEFDDVLNISDGGNGTVEINGGEMHVFRLIHNLYNLDGTAYTTINGGKLVAQKMELYSGILNIAGGTFQIQEASMEDIQKWVADGLISFYGVFKGVEGVNYSLTPLEKGYEIKAIRASVNLG